MDFLCLFFVVFLSILGAVDLAKGGIEKIFFGKKKTSTAEIKIPIYGHCENIEFIIRKILFKYKWIKNIKNIKINIINNGADPETLRICNQLRKNHSNIHLINRHNPLQIDKYHPT